MSGRCRAAVAACVVLLVGSPAMAQKAPFDPFATRPSPTVGGQVITSVDVVDAPVNTVFKMISDLTGWSILMSPEVSKQPPRVNLWIKNLTPDEALEHVVSLAGLVMDRQKTTVLVMTFGEYCDRFGVEKKVLGLTNAKATDVAKLLSPFVEGKDQRARILADERSNKVVLFLPKPLLASMEALVKAVDIPMRYDSDAIRVVPLANLEAGVIAQDLEKFLSKPARDTRLAPVPVPGFATTQSAEKVTDAHPWAGAEYLVQFMAEPRLNVIVLRGKAGDVEEAVKLITQLDAPQTIVTESYQARYVNAKELFDAITNIVKNDGQRGVGISQSRTTQGGIRVALSGQNNRIVVEGTQKDQQRIKMLIEAIDKPLPPGRGMIRVYRLENATADEVTKVLNDVASNSENAEVKMAGAKGGPLQPAVNGIQRVRPPGGPNGDASAPPMEKGGLAGDEEVGASGEKVKASITAAAEINAVVVRAVAAEQEEFAQLIADLDKPRDQVMLEVTLVTVRTSEAFNLGLELGGHISINDESVTNISLTNFGIGQVNPTTGTVRIANPPPFGLNTALFNSDDFSLVLNALKTVGDTRITSSPKILVEDNSPAQISQITQEPFSVVNQGTVTTTTSFGGFVDAGTVLSVIPHMSTKDWLRLSYNVTFSSFNSRPSPSLPPPKLEHAIQGSVRIPAEHTVVLGGLVNSRQDRVTNGVPCLSDIPILGEAFKNRTDADTKETLFVFVRPILVRDTSFDDLLRLSKVDVRKANWKTDCPVNEPQLFRKS